MRKRHARWWTSGPSTATREPVIPTGHSSLRPTAAERTSVRRSAAVLLAILISAAGVFIWFSTRPKLTGALELARTDFASLPGWRVSDPALALAAFRRSCGAILRMPADRAMGGSGYAGTAGDWRGICSSLPLSTDRAGARRWFESAFAPFSVSAGGNREALFTGYYEPEIHASRARHGGYLTPIYGTPRDLVTADLGLFRRELASIRITGHVVGARFVPFPPRAQIDAAGINNA